MIENTVVLDKESLDEVRSLVRCADLEGVRFLKYSFSLEVENLGTNGDIELSSQSKVSGDLAEGILRLVFDLRLKGTREQETVLTISGRLEANYRLPEEEKPTAAQIKSFGRANGMLNVWPYWREFVQSATLRAGLAPLTLPLFRVLPAPPKKS